MIVFVKSALVTPASGSCRLETAYQKGGRRWKAGKNSACEICLHPKVPATAVGKDTSRFFNDPGC